MNSIPIGAHPASEAADCIGLGWLKRWWTVVSSSKKLHDAAPLTVSVEICFHKWAWEFLRLKNVVHIYVSLAIRDFWSKLKSLSKWTLTKAIFEGVSKFNALFERL